MKSIIVLLVLTAGLSQAQAQSNPHISIMNCIITEGGEQTRETKVQHNYDVTASHSFTTFDSAYATGFVAVSRSYAVINVISKESGRGNSFYGKIGSGNVVGGTLAIGKDGNSWFQVKCQ